MRGPFILSTVLHVAVVLLAWIGLPSFAPDRVIEPRQVIDVAVVTDIATKIPPTPPKPVVKAKPKPEPKSKPKPKKAPPPPKPQASLPKPPAPPPPPPDAVSLPEKPKKPEPKKPEVKPKPVVKPEPKPEPKPVAKPKPEPKPKEPPKPKKVAKPDVKAPPRPRRKPKPPPEDDFASVLKTVEKAEEAAQAEETRKVLRRIDRRRPEKARRQHQTAIATGQPSRSTAVDERGRRAEAADRRLLESTGRAPEAENLVVEVRLVINRDRTVQSAQIVDTSRMFREPFYRAAAESVIRAIKNPRCTPLALPQGKYDLWKETRLTFDPRELVGR